MFNFNIFYNILENVGKFLTETSFFVFLCLFVCLFVCVFVCLVVCVFVCLFVCVLVWLVDGHF